MQVLMSLVGIATIFTFRIAYQHDPPTMTG